METMYCTLTAREIVTEGAAVTRTCGGSRQLVFVREAARSAVPAAGKVIDLFAWKAEREQSEEPELLWENDGKNEVYTAGSKEFAEGGMRMMFSRESRRARRCALSAELLCCGAVVAVMVTLVLKVLGAV